MPTVQHFEIAADDIQRALEFYKNVFEWTIQKIDNAVCPKEDYWGILEILNYQAA